MKSNILLLIDRYLPNPLSSAVMYRDLAQELSFRGNEITIIAGASDISSEIETSIEAGIKVIRIKSPDLKSNWFKRLFNEMALGRRIWKYTKNSVNYSDFDMVIYYSPTIFWSSLVRKLKRKFNLNTYLVLRDLFPKWAADLGIISKYGLIYFFFKIFEYKLYRTADCIGVQSPNSISYFAENFYLRSFKTEVLYNWVKIEDANFEKSSLREDLDLNDKIIFLYGGNIGVAQDLDNLLNLAKNLLDQNNIYFLMVGAGTEFKRLQNRIHVENINNMTLMPSVSPSDFQTIVSTSDVGLISLNRNFKTQNIPGKILSYMQSKKPMLASINPGNDLFDFFPDNDCGFALLNGEDSAYIDAAKKLAADNKLRARMGQNGYQLLKEVFTVESAADQIVQKIPSQN